jgi:hypothetical protein
VERNLCEERCRKDAIIMHEAARKKKKKMRKMRKMMKKTKKKRCIMDP